MCACCSVFVKLCKSQPAASDRPPPPLDTEFMEFMEVMELMEAALRRLLSYQRRLRAAEQQTHAQIDFLRQPANIDSSAIISSFSNSRARFCCLMV